MEINLGRMLMMDVEGTANIYYKLSPAATEVVILDVVWG